MIVILKLFYESPRPFWNSTKIVTFENFCDFDFACPGNHVFSLCFFWTYTTFMTFQKYSVEINYTLVIFLYSLLIVVTGLTIYGTFLFGIDYLYQSMVSLLYSATFGIIIVNFDAQILTMCEQIGFIVRSSRKYKFYLLFISIGLYVIGLILLDNNQTDWSDQQIWIINVSDVSYPLLILFCRSHLAKTSLIMLEQHSLELPVLSICRPSCSSWSAWDLAAPTVSWRLTASTGWKHPSPKGSWGLSWEVSSPLQFTKRSKQSHLKTSRFKATASTSCCQASSFRL